MGFLDACVSLPTALAHIFRIAGWLYRPVVPIDPSFHLSGAESALDCLCTLSSGKAHEEKDLQQCRPPSIPEKQRRARRALCDSWRCGRISGCFARERSRVLGGSPHPGPQKRFGPAKTRNRTTPCRTNPEGREKLGTVQGNGYKVSSDSGKSLRLSVMSESPCSRAVAATIMSAKERVRPFCAHALLSKPARRAIAPVNG
jgi:hypothetical protein